MLLPRRTTHYQLVERKYSLLLTRVYDNPERVYKFLPHRVIYPLTLPGNAPLLRQFQTDIHQVIFLFVQKDLPNQVTQIPLSKCRIYYAFLSIVDIHLSIILNYNCMSFVFVYIFSDFAVIFQIFVSQIVEVVYVYISFFIRS